MEKHLAALALRRGNNRGGDDVHSNDIDSVPLIGADQVWTILDSYGQPVTGQGIRVAIIDTGIDYTHADLGECFGPDCKVVDGYDFHSGDAGPWDDYGHCTHVAGIVAANGTIKGVAPDVSLYAYNVLGSTGGGYASNIIAAIERATDPDQDPATDDAVDVISMSLGRSGNPDDAMSSTPFSLRPVWTQSRMALSPPGQSQHGGSPTGSPGGAGGQVASAQRGCSFLP